MIQYIYFVKCPNCDDEPFDFFDEAKGFAMGCLSNKPIITQTEVCRNDFGECTDSADLGTVWSWEEVMAKPDPVEAPSTFSKNDLVTQDTDPEFDALDNSVEPVEPRKPVPADMSIEDLVETMEENEDTVECKNCGELFDKSECEFDLDYHGYLCWHCQRAVVDHGGELNISEYPLEEAFNPNEKVEFDYDNLKVFLQGPKRDVDDWDAVEEEVSYTFIKTKEDIATDIWENFIQEDDAKDIEGGLETLEDDKAWTDFLDIHFDDLLEKYYDKLLAYYEKYAIEEYESTHMLGESRKPFLEELEEADDYRARLTDCPECGFKESFDHETGICINCGFNI
jgi:hypothetical protein